MTGFLLGATGAVLFAVLAYVVYDAAAISVIDLTADRSVIVGGVGAEE